MLEFKLSDRFTFNLIGLAYCTHIEGQKQWIKVNSNMSKRDLDINRTDTNKQCQNVFVLAEA